MEDDSFNIPDFYTEHKGTGTPIVFIHGFTLDARMWDQQFYLLSQSYQCLRYDMRGYGRSSPLPHKPYSHYIDLHYILEYYKMQPAILVGLSMGGRVALQCALEYPGDVKGLVLIDTAIDGYPWSIEYASWVDSFEKILEKEDIIEARKQWLNGKLFETAMRKPQVAHELRTMLDSFTGFQWTAADPSYQTPIPSYKRLEEVDCPVLTLVGEYDLPDFKGCADVIVTRVKNSEKIIVPSAGHCSNMENPIFVNKAIQQWLQQLPT